MEYSGLNIGMLTRGCLMQFVMVVICAVLHKLQQFKIYFWVNFV